MIIDGFTSKYPYTDFHTMNLDWLLAQMLQLRSDMKDFVNLNTIKYADPIQWNITTQYQGNTVVVEPVSGDAYLSTQPVPSGVAITDTDYWTIIGSFGSIFTDIKASIAAADEGPSTVASANRAVDDLVWLSDKLYVVTAPIATGESYVPGTNCELITIELLLKREKDARIESVNTLSNDISQISSSILQISGQISDIEDEIAALPNIRVINVVSDLGADDTGTTDCGAIVNAALQDPQYDGYPLYFPAGTYKVTTPINLDRNMISAGTLYTDSSNVILNIVSKRIKVLFNIIGFSTDGVVNSLSAANATNTSIQFDAQYTNDIMAQVEVRGLFLNGNVCINFVGGSKFYQNISINIMTIQGKSKCVNAVLSNGQTGWMNEILFNNSVFNNIDGTGIAVNLENNTGQSLMNGWKFIGCSFEISNHVFVMVRSKALLTACRMSIYETYTERGGVLFDMDTSSTAIFIGEFDFDGYFQYFNLKDLNSRIYWLGIIDRSSYKCPSMMTFRSDSDTVNTVGFNSYGYAAIADFTSNNETISIPYGMRLTDGLTVKLNNHTGCIVDIVYNDAYRPLTTYNNVCSGFKPFMLEVIGNGTFTLKNANGISGNNNRTIDTSLSHTYMVTANGIYPL